jgi:hypothetical protein
MPIQNQSAKNGLENFEGVFIDAAFIDIPTSQTIPLPPTPRKGIVFAGSQRLPQRRRHRIDVFHIAIRGAWMTG